MSNDVRIELPYRDEGIGTFVVSPSNVQKMYRPKAYPVVRDVVGAVEAAITAPIGSASIKDLVRLCDRNPPRVSVVVDDMTRATPVDTLLPPVLRVLTATGIPARNIVITVALGTHRAMTDEELKERVGRKIFEHYRVENSHFSDRSMMVLIGHADDGVPIYIDRTVAAADLRIGIGSIVPHGAVGWSGGAKILYPGVAGEETVKRFHFLHGVTRRNMKGRTECSVRTAMERWVEKIGLDFILNTVLDQNGEVCRVVAGHYVEAQREGARTAEKIYRYTGEPKTEIVVCVSYPHDGDFWQAAKGIFSGEQLTVPGGHIVLVTPCYEGEGNHPRFLERSGDDGVHALLRAVLRGEEPQPDDPVSIAPACLLNEIARTRRVHVVSPNLDRDRVESAGFTWSRSIQERVDELLALRPRAEISTVLHSDLSFQTATGEEE